MQTGFRAGPHELRHAAVKRDLLPAQVLLSCCRRADAHPKVGLQTMFDGRDCIGQGGTVEQIVAEEIIRLVKKGL